MRRFVAEHAADAAAAAAGGGSTRCSIFTLCLIADLGVDYINLIPHACALPLRRREGDRLMAGEGDGGCINIGWRRSFFLFFSSDHLRIRSSRSLSRSAGGKARGGGKGKARFLSRDGIKRGGGGRRRNSEDGF